jgi:hypothetical protein
MAAQERGINAAARHAGCVDATESGEFCFELAGELGFMNVGAGTAISGESVRLNRLGV